MDCHQADAARYILAMVPAKRISVCHQASASKTDYAVLSKNQLPQSDGAVSGAAFQWPPLDDV
jgi:hypothetical protein